jgi:hypothetical protein
MNHRGPAAVQQFVKVGRALVVSLSLWTCACTSGEGEPRPSIARSPPASSSTVDVAAASFTLPSSWSYSVSRHAPDSWSFEMSARHPFNAGARCAPKTGALGSLLRFEKAFVFGYAYRSEFPKAAGHLRQPPGSFRLDPETRAAYETSGCRRTYRIDFDHAGYYFSVHVALSENAGAAIEDEVLDVLNSIVEDA